MLFIFSGLPGSGKSTVAKILSERLRAVYLRVDTVEQAIRSVSEHSQKIGPEGYFVLYELARENLKLGSNVVTDSVNDINLVRDAFRNIAISLNVPFLEIEILCSDKKQHRYRVENRRSDILGLTPQTGNKYNAVTMNHGTENICNWIQPFYQQQNVSIKFSQ